MFTDLREFIKALEDNGELRRINKSVSTELEITEILDRLVKRPFTSITNLLRAIHFNPNHIRFIKFNFMNSIATFE